MIYTLWMLFISFFKIGVLGFGGGYAMMSLILAESELFGITMQQFADLNTLDMIVPGPIAINAATYVGYLGGGAWGALSATLGVMAPSLIIVTLVLRFINKYRGNRIMEGVLTGIKPAAVGLIAAAAANIAMGVLLKPGLEAEALMADPLNSLSFLLVGIFAAAAVLNIRFRVNPIWLMLGAGVVGAVFLG